MTTLSDEQLRNAFIDKTQTALTAILSSRGLKGNVRSTIDENGGVKVEVELKNRSTTSLMASWSAIKDSADAKVEEFVQVLSNILVNI